MASPVRQRFLIVAIGAGGHVRELHVASRDTTTIGNMIRASRARMFVVQEDWDAITGLPIWGVFEARSVEFNNPMPGVHSLGQPLRTFTAETPDAATVYALAVLGKR